jgi:hypothetical protein
VVQSWHHHPQHALITSYIVADILPLSPFSFCGFSSITNRFSVTLHCSALCLLSHSYELP